MVAGSGWLVPL